MKLIEINSSIVHLNSSMLIATLNQYDLDTPIKYQKYTKEKSNYNIIIRYK